MPRFSPHDVCRRARRSSSTLLAVLLVLAPGQGVGGDPAESTVISAQTLRHALNLASDKQVRIMDLHVWSGDKAAVAVFENHVLVFGTLADRSGSILVGADGTIQENNDAIYYGGTTRAAEFTITGDALANVSIDFLSTPAGGFTLDDFVTNFGAPPVNTQFDATGQLVMDVGARLTIDSALVNPGANQLLSYTIRAIYP